MSSAWIMARLTWRECLRRKVFLLVPIVTVGFVSLYGLGAHYAFRSARRAFGVPGNLDPITLTGASMVGVAMFMILFLGSALGIFLTFATVRGEAEQGTLQAMIVRPVARHGILLGRWLGAASVATVYVIVMYSAVIVLTGVIGGWWPSSILVPGVGLMLGVVIVIALTILGSVYLSSIPNGIAMFMAYGAALLGGLMGQLGEVLGSEALRKTGVTLAWALPFEALFQSGLHSLTADTEGITRFVVRLGPLGGAQEGGTILWVWSCAFLLAVGGLALLAFRRRDL